ncbi:hypothetical protein ACFQ60_47610 [Streptomyces zhihengii]
MKPYAMEVATSVDGLSVPFRSSPAGGEATPTASRCTKGCCCAGSRSTNWTGCA